MHLFWVRDITSKESWIMKQRKEIVQQTTGQNIAWPHLFTPLLRFWFSLFIAHLHGCVHTNTICVCPLLPLPTQTCTPASLNSAPLSYSAPLVPGKGTTSVRSVRNHQHPSSKGMISRGNFTPTMHFPDLISFITFSIGILNRPQWC